MLDNSAVVMNSAKSGVYNIKVKRLVRAIIVKYSRGQRKILETKKNGIRAVLRPLEYCERPAVRVATLRFLERTPSENLLCEIFRI